MQHFPVDGGKGGRGVGFILQYTLKLSHKNYLYQVISNNEQIESSVDTLPPTTLLFKLVLRGLQGVYNTRGRGRYG